MLAALEKSAFFATRALSVVGLAALLMLALLTLADGLGRWMFNFSIESVRDIGGLIVAIAVSCCLPMGLMERGHITVRVIEKFGDFAGRVTSLLASLLVQTTLVLMAWQFFLHAEKMSRARETTWALQVPVAPFWYGVDAIMWCAVAVQAIVLALDFARLVRAPYRLEERHGRKHGEFQ